MPERLVRGKLKLIRPIRFRKKSVEERRVNKSWNTGRKFQRHEIP